MKEVLTKSFWQGVKKTYDEALNGPPAEAAGAPDEIIETASAPPEEPRDQPPSGAD